MDNDNVKRESAEIIREDIIKGTIIYRRLLEGDWDNRSAWKLGKGMKRQP
jgi:hypothetical protein